MSDQVLSQEEIDALFMSMSKGKDQNMSQQNETVIKALEKIEEDIDTISLNDESGWIDLYNRLERSASETSGEVPELGEFFSLSLSALSAISQQTALDSLSLIDELFNALNSAIEFLKGKPDALGLLVESVQVLSKSIRNDVEPEANDELALDEKHNNSSDEALTLDDVVAMLIELEPEDTEELTRFCLHLEKMLTDTFYPLSSRKRIESAITAIQLILEGTADDPDDALTEAGLLLEKAIVALEQDDPADTDDAEISNQFDFEDTAEKIELLNKAVEVRAKDEIKSDWSQQAEVSSVAEADDFPAEDEEPDKNYMPADAETELLSAFVTESSELITNAEDALLMLETDPEDMEAIGSVFRAFHTVKGTAAFLELSLISEMGHHAESLLSRVREGEIRYTGKYADLSLKTLDMLKELVMSVQNALNGKPLLRPNGYNELMRILKDPEKAGISEEPEIENSPQSLKAEIPDDEDKDKPDDQVLSFADKNSRQVADKKVSLVTDVTHALKHQQRPEGANKQIVESSIRVPTERLDRFIDMVGELVVAHSMVIQDEVVAGGKYHDLFKKVNHTSKIVRELQDMSMSMRMIPLKSTFRKMARLVRDLSRKVGKKVVFNSEGDDTEIDRNMVDIINDPLVHMVRNALDHGIESPHIREKMGKPAYGKLQLSAYHSAGNVIVEVTDDGKGIDKDLVVERAIERGLINDSSQMTEREIFNLLFEPGFSTAEIVSDISGRGVGMDVVKKNIENLRGQIEIQSKPGKGSLFKISLPLTLAIIDGMVVRVGSEKYVIPTVSIIRSIRPKPNEITTVLNKGEMITIQGRLIPLFRLGSLFYLKDAEPDPTKALVVIVENQANQAGLLIDELIGSQQIVIKTMGEAMGDIPGISGSAIMPNGRVGLILDVGEIVRLANSPDGKKMKDLN